MRSLGILAVFLLALLTDALTQEQPLQPGQRVRVTAPGLGMNKQAATFGALERGVITVTGDSTIQLALSEVTRLDVYRGSRSRAGKGALIGGCVTGGLGLGLSLAYVAGGCWNGCGDGGTVVLATIAATAVFALPGAGIGALIGAGSRRDRWDEVPLDRLRVGIAPTRNGFGIGARIAF